MWAAKMASLRGNQVTLYEKGDDLGGQVLMAAKGAGRDEFGGHRAQRAQPAGPSEGAGEAGLGGHGGVVLDFNRTWSSSPPARPKTCPVAGADGPGIYKVWQVLTARRSWANRCSWSTTTATTRPRHRRVPGRRQEGEHGHLSLFVGAELGPSQDLYLARQRLMQRG